MVSHSLAKHRNLNDDMYRIKDILPPAADALYHDSLHINK